MLRSTPNINSKELVHFIKRIEDGRPLKHLETIILPERAQHINNKNIQRINNSLRPPTVQIQKPEE